MFVKCEKINKRETKRKTPDKSGSLSKLVLMHLKGVGRAYTGKEDKRALRKSDTETKNISDGLETNFT